MSQRADQIGCAEFCERLDDWLDGAVDAAEAILMEAHLESCELCRNEHALAEQVVAELRTLPEMDIPDSVLAKVREKTGPSLAERMTGYLSDRIAKPVPAVAALAAAALVLVVLLPRTPTESSFSRAEVARATEETKLALAYVSGVTRRAEREVASKVLEGPAVARTARGLERTLEFMTDQTALGGALSPSPSPNLKGS